MRYRVMGFLCTYEAGTRTGLEVRCVDTVPTVHEIEAAAAPTESVLLEGCDTDQLVYEDRPERLSMQEVMFSILWLQRSLVSPSVQA